MQNLVFFLLCYLTGLDNYKGMCPPSHQPESNFTDLKSIVPSWFIPFTALMPVPVSDSRVSALNEVGEHIACRFLRWIFFPFGDVKIFLLYLFRTWELCKVLPVFSNTVSACTHLLKGISVAPRLGQL